MIIIYFVLLVLFIKICSTNITVLLFMRFEIDTLVVLFTIYCIMFVILMSRACDSKNGGTDTASFLRSAKYSKKLVVLLRTSYGVVGVKLNELTNFFEIALKAASCSCNSQFFLETRRAAPIESAQLDTQTNGVTAGCALSKRRKKKESEKDRHRRG